MRLHLSAAERDGIGDLVDFAERGWEDFLYQAKFGDYTEEDQTGVRASWKAAQRTASALLRALETEPTTEEVK